MFVGAVVNSDYFCKCGINHLQLIYIVFTYFSSSAFSPSKKPNTCHDFLFNEISSANIGAQINKELINTIEIFFIN